MANIQPILEQMSYFYIYIYPGRGLLLITYAFVHASPPLSLHVICNAMDMLTTRGLIMYVFNIFQTIKATIRTHDISKIDYLIGYHQIPRLIIMHDMPIIKWFKEM